jgi:tetratricopeptide (TPR) repeat protein
MARGEIRTTIAELQNIFHPAYRGALFIKALVVAAAITALLLIDQRHRLEWALLLPLVAFAALAVRSLRGVSELAVLIPAVIGVHGRRLGRRPAAAIIVSLVVVLMSLGGDVAVLRWGVPMGREGMRRAGFGVDPVNCPAGVVRFLQVEKPQGRIFNIMAFGGYLIWQLWPQKQVFVDGRLDVYSPEFLEAYQKLMDTGQGWEEMVHRYGIALAMIDYQDEELLPRGLLAVLRDDPDWVCVFCGDNALIYARRSAENQALLDRFGMAFDPSLRSVESLDAFASTAAPEELQKTISALEGMICLAPEENSATMILGRLLDRIGRSAEGAARLRRAVEMNPSSPHSRLMWIQALQRSGDRKKARQEMSAIYRQMPDDLSALLLVADIEREEGRLAEAIAALERACSQDPESYLVHLRLGVLNAQMGRVAQARAHLELAQRIRPGDPAAQRNLEKLSGIAEQR